jgi:hypothetical protein
LLAVASTPLTVAAVSALSTLTATMTAAAITLLQRWQHHLRCLGHSNNHHKTVSAPITVAQWPPLFFSFSGAYTQPVLVTYWPVISSLLAIAPSQSWSHQGCDSTPIATMGTSTHWDPRCRHGTTALTTTTPASAPLQRGSSHHNCGTAITTAMSVAAPLVLLGLQQHRRHRCEPTTAAAPTITAAVAALLSPPGP